MWSQFVGTYDQEDVVKSEGERPKDTEEQR